MKNLTKNLIKNLINKKYFHKTAFLIVEQCLL